MESKFNIIESHFNYKSSTCEFDQDRYITKLNIDFYGVNYDNLNRTNKLKIGNAKIQMLLFGLALKNNFSFYYIFDCSKSLSELGEEIYDWENDELKKVFDYSNCDYTNPNILFIENFEFNPDYKIQSWLLGSIKDILYKFDNMFGIMIINVSPVENIEFRTINNEVNATKTKFENYNSKTEKRNTFEELSEIYKQLELKQINKSSYYYYIPTVLNKSLQSIKID